MKPAQALILVLASSMILGGKGVDTQGMQRRKLLQTPSSCACVCGSVHEGYVQGVSLLAGEL